MFFFSITDFKLDEDSYCSTFRKEEWFLVVITGFIISHLSDILQFQEHFLLVAVPLEWINPLVEMNLRHYYQTCVNSRPHLGFLPAISV